MDTGTDLELKITLEGTIECVVLPVHSDEKLDSIAKKVIKMRSLGVSSATVSFYSVNDRFNSINREKTVGRTGLKTVFMRYPFSKSTVEVKLNVNGKEKHITSIHSGGIWYKIISEICVDYPFINPNNLFEFTCSVDTMNGKRTRKVDDEILFNKMVSSAIIVENNEINVTVLFDIGDRKCFSEWSFKDAVQLILKKPHVRNLQDLEKLVQDVKTDKLNEEDFLTLKNELKERITIFKITSLSCECSIKQIISTYLLAAMRNLRKTDERLFINEGKALDGTVGYGNLDYAILFKESVVIITEAKNGNFVSGCGRNIVQLHSACQELETVTRKRKLSQVPPPVYGIVTDGFSWIFLQYIEARSSPNLRISKMININCMDKDENELRLVVNWIIQIVEEQIKNYKDEPVFKKSKTHEFS